MESLQKKICSDNLTITNTVSDTNTNYYLNGISKSNNQLTFEVNGATNQTYTFGSNAFTSYGEPTYTSAIADTNNHHIVW